MYKIICNLILILLVVNSLPAQEKVSFDIITSRMAEQLNMYPKEKLHVHIDRSCYLPGDTLWFKAYMVNASSHIPIRLSRYVYVELVNPENETIGRVKIRPDEMNQFHGYIPIPGTNHRNHRKIKGFIFLIINYLNISYFLYFCHILPIFRYSVHF